MVAAMFMFSSCDGGNKPSAVAEQSMKCLQEKDFKGYVDLIYFSEEDQKAADFQEKKDNMASMVEKTLKQQTTEEIKEYKVISEEIQEKDSTALVRMEVKYGGDKVDTTDVKLRMNQAGEWKLENNK